jgi:chromosome segregation ATPase
LAGVEHDLGSARTLNSELQGQLEEAANLISELEAQVDSVRHDNRDAKQEIAAQAEEINFAANRANDLEEMMLTSQSNREEAQGQVEALQEQLAAEQEG